MSTQGTNGSGVEGSKRPRRSGSRPPTPSSGGGNGAASEETATQGTNTTDVVEIEDDGDRKVGTANHQKKGYMAETVHFIDDDWKLKSFLLR